MHHVFVSYSRSDSAWVNELLGRLEAAGHETWIDQRDIPLTLPWFDQIGDGIAGADLFLICDSPASRESANCGAETALAFDAGKRSLEVAVGGDVEAAAVAVDEAIAGLDPARRLRTELMVAARDWDRGGRERGSLLAARAWRRINEGASFEPPLSPVEEAFLKACRRRSRRRTTVSVGIGLTLAVALLAMLVFNEAVKKSNRENDREAASFTRTRAALAGFGADPYLGLSEAAALGQNESANDAAVIDRALATEAPDDAFRVPAAARRFATPVVGGTVAVASSAGKVWERGAAAREARRAQPAAGEASSATRPVGMLQVRIEPHSAVVDVRRGGALWRRIAFSARPQTLRASPDGRELAAAIGGGAEIADLQLGAVRTTLAGAPGKVRDLAWSRDGRRLWALAGGFVVSWKTRDGRVLVDDPEARFEALLPGTDASTVWTVEQNGELRELSVADGRELAELKVPDDISSGGGAADGSVAALSGDRGLWLVPLRGDGGPQLMRIPGCTLGRPAFADRDTVYLPCISGDLLKISVSRRSVLQRIRINRLGVFAARPLPHTDVVLASDTLADLFAIGGHGQVDELFRSRCGGTITRIAASASGTVIAPAGSGTGISGCLRRGVLKGEDPTERRSWHFVAVDDNGSSALAETSAVSRTGDVFAYGYADGTVVLHPTTAILPNQTITNVIGEIRDMYVTPSNVLLVATRSGVVQQLPLCGPCLRNRTMAKAARSRIDRGVALGIATRAAAE